LRALATSRGRTSALLGCIFVLFVVLLISETRATGGSGSGPSSSSSSLPLSSLCVPSTSSEVNNLAHPWQPWATPRGSAVILETRIGDDLILVVRHMVAVLPVDFRVIIYHGVDNSYWVADVFRDLIDLGKVDTFLVPPNTPDGHVNVDFIPTSWPGSAAATECFKQRALRGVSPRVGMGMGMGMGMGAGDVNNEEEIEEREPVDMRDESRRTARRGSATTPPDDTNSTAGSSSRSRKLWSYAADAANFFYKQEVWLDTIPSPGPVIVFATDGFICDSDPDRIWVYTVYDYIGAPWPKKAKWDYPAQFNLAGGNSGFSMRSLTAMRRAFQEFTRVIGHDPGTDNTYDDVFYSEWILRAGGRLPTREMAESFSVETQINAMPFGQHKFWWNQRGNNWRGMLEACIISGPVIGTRMKASDVRNALG
jgi:hypothetical protein